MNSRIPNRQKAPENSDSGLVSSQFQPRPFAIQPQSEEASPQQQETPDLQTQLERAKRFGPDFSRVRVRAQAPRVTFESKLFFGEQRNQEEPVTDSMAQPVTSMPAPPVNLPPIQRRDAEWVGNQPNPLAARMMPPIQRRDAESVGNQPSPLAARMMPPIQRRDAESVGNQPSPLPVRMMPVVQRQSERAASIQSQPWIQRIEEQPEAKLEEDSLPVQAKLENATIECLPEVEQESEKEHQQTTTVGKLPTLDVSGASGGEKLKSDETKQRKAQGIEELPSQIGVASPEAATGKTLSDAKHSPNDPKALASAEPKVEDRNEAGSNQPKVNQLMQSAVGQPQSKTESKPNATAGSQPKQQPTAQGDSSKNAKADGASVAGKDGAAPDAKGVAKAATKHIPPETADVAQKAQTQNNSRKEEVAAKKAEATKAVEEASAKKDTVISASEQLTSAQASFAAPQPKAMFATSSEGISALQPEEVLGTAGNGLVIYQTDNPEKSLAAANAGAFVHQIPEDKAANAREQQRIQAEAAIAQFTASGSQRTAQISALGTTIGPRIQAAAGQATASVDAAIAQNQSAIINGIDQARTQVQSQAQGAKSQITGQHDTTVAAIQASTTAARDRLQTEYQASLAQLSQLESTMAGQIAEPFNKAANDFRAAGVTVGNEAIQIGETFKSRFAGESPPEPSNAITEFLESFDRDTYVQNWRQAKTKAAGDVAVSYRDGLINNANEKANELSTSQSEVLKGMQNLGSTTRTELEVKYNAALQELSQSEQSALEMATQTLNSQLQSVDQNLNATLGSLDQMQATQLSQLDSLGQQQKLGINAQAGQVTAALQQGVHQATTNLQGAFQQFANQAQGIQAPNLEVINSVIAEAQGQLDSLMATTQTELETGINKSEQGIVQQAQQTVGSINTAGQQAASSGSMMAQEFTASMTQEVQNATQAFAQLQNGHTNAVNGSTQKTAGEFKNLTGKVQQQLDGVVQNLNTKLGESVTQLENGLRGSLKGSDQLGVSFGTSLFGGAGGEALNGALGKLGAKLSVNKIDNAALKTGGEFVTDTISETATDVTSQVVFEGKDLSWQTVGESAGTSAFGNLAGRGANRAYGDRLRNLGSRDRTSTDVPNLDQPTRAVGNTTELTQIVDQPTRPVGEPPEPTQIADQPTRPVGETSESKPLVDPNIHRPIGEAPDATTPHERNTTPPEGPTPTPEDRKPSSTTSKTSPTQDATPTDPKADSSEGRKVEVDETSVVAQQTTHDGHQLKVLEDGRVVRCSQCELLESRYQHLLTNQNEHHPDLQNDVKKLAEDLKTIRELQTKQLNDPNQTEAQRRQNEQQIEQWLAEVNQKLHNLEIQWYNELKNQDKLTDKDKAELETIERGRLQDLDAAAKLDLTPEQLDGLVGKPGGKPLNTEQLNKLIEHAQKDWKQVKEHYLQYPNLMQQLVNHRTQEIQRLIDTVKSELVDVEAAFQGKDGKIQQIAAGSTDLTSDYDVVFYSENKTKAIEAIQLFNQKFREEFGRESGFVFDTNVYTPGFLPDAAYTPKAALFGKLNQLQDSFNKRDKLEAKLKETEQSLRDLDQQQSEASSSDDIQTKRNQLEAEQTKLATELRKFNEDVTKLQTQIRILRRQAGVSAGNLNSTKAVGQEIERFQTELDKKYESQQRRNAAADTATDAVVVADQDVMSLAQQRRNMTDEEWSGFQEQTLQGFEEGSDLQKQTDERFQRANEVYTRTRAELDAEIIAQNKQKDPGHPDPAQRRVYPEDDVDAIKTQNQNAEIEASNLLYVKRLEEVKNILTELEPLRDKRRTKPLNDEEKQRLNQLTIEWNKKQSEALIFANQAYYTGGAAQHVVGNQQMNLGRKLTPEEYLNSFNEQISYALEHITAEEGLGHALWTSGKYLDRATDAVNQLTQLEKLLDGSPMSIDDSLRERVKAMREMAQELLDIKKGKGDYKNLSPEQKGEKAVEVAQQYQTKYGFDLQDINGLRQELIGLSIQINQQVRTQADSYKVENSFEPASSKPQTPVGDSEVETSTDGQTKMATGAGTGKDPTPDTIREGSVRMKEHPHYQESIKQVKEAGFEIKFSEEARVEVKEVVDSDGNVIRVEKTLYVMPKMRYLDLEHELGHIKQLERFGENIPPTVRVMERPDGSFKNAPNQSGVLTTWQNTITEYHNRLVEFIRLYERSASPEVLKEHAKGVEEWLQAYRKKGLKEGRSQTQKAWAEKYFPDTTQLQSRYFEITQTID